MSSMRVAGSAVRAWAREATRKPTAVWALLCVPVFWVGRHTGLVARTPLWLLLAVVAVAYGASPAAHRCLPSPARVGDPGQGADPEGRRTAGGMVPRPRAARVRRDHRGRT